MSSFMSGFLAPFQRMYGSVTGDGMRSDIGEQSRAGLVSDSSLGALGRRRLSRNSPVYENGSFSADLHAAIEESLKCTPKITTSSANQPQIMDTKEKYFQPEQSATTSDAESSKQQHKPKQPDTELKQLKELLVLHLDLISQQQQLIVAKDKHIKSLKSEKNALKCRLERMERRMSLAAHKRESSASPSACFKKESRVPLSSRHETGQNIKSSTVTEDEDQYSSEEFENRGTKRKFLEDREVRLKMSPKLSPGRRKQQTNTNSKPSDSKITGIDKLHLCDQLVNKSMSKNLKEDPANPTEDVLRTDVMFYVLPNKMEDQISSKQNLPISNIEVPCWRLNPVTNCYALEGTENLEDEAYLKRHQKPEVEEKRRKRWDLQRLRDQKMHEKLEKGRYRESLLQQQTRHDKKDESLTTGISLLNPQLSDIQYIEMCNEVPVNAFGYPIPTLESEEFQLPDFMETDTNNGKQGSKCK